MIFSNRFEKPNSFMADNFSTLNRTDEISDVFEDSNVFNQEFSELPDFDTLGLAVIFYEGFYSRRLAIIDLGL